MGAVLVEKAGESCVGVVDNDNKIMCSDSETFPPPIDEVCASCGKTAVDKIEAMHRL